jgi:hypothetical protein
LLDLQVRLAALGAVGVAGRLTVGTAEQATGDCLSGRARGALAYASALDSLASASPSLPESDKYKSKAEEARNAAKELFEKAREAYKAADTAYGSSGSTGPAKANLDRLNQRLRDLVKASGGDPDMIPSRGEPVTEAAPAEAAAAPAAAAQSGTPQETIMAFLDQNTDPEAKAGIYLTESPAEQQALKALLGMESHGKKLNDAVKAKFGQDMSELGAQFAAQMGGGIDPAKLANLKASDVQVTVNGDSAEAAIPGAPKPVKLKQKDGKWLIVFTSIAPVAPEQMAMFGAMAGPANKVMDDLAAEVAAGKFADPQAVMQALMQRMMQGAAKNLQGGGG